MPGAILWQTIGQDDVSGELSLDGSVRSVRGALSAALAARECHCTPPMIQRYVSKISGPLLDRIEIHIEVPAVKYKELRAPSSAEDSAYVRQRVIEARNRQLERFHSEKKTYANAQMMPKMIRKHCAISPEGEKLLENAITRLGLSAPAHDRILKVARTMANLNGGGGIEPRHLSEAI
jgi:magnesium chelatase family protein